MVSLGFSLVARRLGSYAIAFLGLSGAAQAQTAPTRILFVGNSFTHGKFLPVRQYNSPNVTDENYGLPASDPRAEGANEAGPWGGIPGIFKKMADQAGLNYEVHIEAISSSSLQNHYSYALAVIAQAKWNKVVLQDQSTYPLPNSRGGNRSAFYTGATSLEQAIHTANSAAQVYLYQTWARADLTYQPTTTPNYQGLPIDSMTQDLHDGYYRQFFNNGRYAGVAPAGDAWLRAIQAGVAMRNPYTPDPTKLDLWGADNYHPSIWGAYLNACVLFYRLTGLDPRTLGASEQAAAALGITPTAAVALQQVAYDQVNVVVTAPVVTTKAFTPGNFVAVRVGDGSATLTSAAAPVFLAEYTPTGTLVQTIPMPTADAGANFAFTNSGTAGSDNNLTRSADGRYLVLAGYSATPGTASVTSTASAATNRVIGRVAADGSFDTSTRINDAFGGTNFRSAASANGTTFYAAGGNSGIRYLPLGNTGPTTALSAGALVNFRYINIFGGNLYAASAASPNYGVNQIGTGLPTVAGQAVTLLPGFPSASGPSPYALYLADLSTVVPGMDVAYVTDDNTTGGIQKWSLVNGTWTLNGTIGGSATALLRGLAGTTTSASAVTLVASGGGGIYSVADNAGYNAAPSTATLPAPLVVPGTNTSFRGVALAPVAATLAARAAGAALAAEVYPVPATHQLLVQLPASGVGAAVQAALFNSLGQQVLRQQTTVPTSGAPLSLSVANLPNGVYTLRLQMGERALSKHVVILH
jgi:hypothetical protein